MRLYFALKKFSLFLTILAIPACVHPKIKYRKAYLLDPTMDPGKTGGLQTGILASEAMIGIEHGNMDAGGSLGASCPTCGG